MLVSMTVCGTTGYATGLGESGRHALMVILPVLLTVVITIIADLDNPRRGLSRSTSRAWLTYRRRCKNTSESGLGGSAHLPFSLSK